MKICIAGKNLIAIKAVRFLISKGIAKKDIYVCLNRTDKGIHEWQPSLKKYSEDIGIEKKKLSELYDIKNLLFISLEFDQIIKPEKFKSRRLFNIHFSKLPVYKGMYTAVWPILNGETYLGVTLHFIDSGIDTGNIVDQIEFKLLDSENSFDLYIKFLEHSYTLFKRNFSDLMNSKELSKPQPIKGSSYYSKKTIDFNNIKINLNNTAFSIFNQIRAFSFRPYQLPVVNNHKICKAIYTKRRSHRNSGVLRKENNDLILSTIDYDLVLLEDRLDDIIKATKENNVDFLKTMYRMGYNLDEKNKNGWTPLIVASFNENKDSFEFLLSTGANVNTFNNNGTSVLMYALTTASKSNNLYFVKELLKRKAEINYSDFLEKSVIHYASKYANKNVIELLNSYIK